MNSVTRFAIGRPRLTIAAWVVLAVTCVPLMLQLTGALKSGGFENPRGEDTTVQNLTPGLRTRMGDALGRLGVEVHVTGAGALDHDLNAQSEKDASTAEMIAFPLLLVVLFLVFRSVVAMLVPLVLAGFALVTASAVGFLLTKLTDVSSLFTNAVSIIGLAVAVDYSLFIVKRYRDELAGGVDYEPALHTAMRTAGRSVQFSGLAVVAALLALF